MSFVYATGLLIAVFALLATTVPSSAAGDDILTGRPGLDALDGGTGNNVLIQD
jgi:hypothetical protein